jgi:hypothetical protein
MRCARFPRSRQGNRDDSLTDSSSPWRPRGHGGGRGRPRSMGDAEGATYSSATSTTRLNREHNQERHPTILEAAWHAARWTATRATGDMCIADAAHHGLHNHRGGHSHALRSGHRRHPHEAARGGEGHERTHPVEQRRDRATYPSDPCSLTSPGLGSFAPVLAGRRLCRRPDVGSTLEPSTGKGRGRCSRLLGSGERRSGSPPLPC